MLGNDTVELLVDFFADPDQLRHVLKLLLKHSQIMGQLLPFYQGLSILRQVKCSRATARAIPFVKQFFSYSFVNIFHNAAAQLLKGLDINPALIPSEVLISLFAICAKHFPLVIVQFDALKNEKLTDDQKDDKQKQILLPLAHQLHQRLLPHLGTLLPIFDEKKAKTEQLIVDNLLTLFFQISICDLPRMNQKQRNLETIHAITGRTHVKEWIKVMNQWCMDFFPYFLEDSDALIAKVLIDVMDPYLPKKENIQKYLTKNIHEIGSSDHETMVQFWDGVRLYVDAALTKFSTLFVSALENVDQASQTKENENVLKNSV